MKKKNNIVYVVHCIDTEGPLHEPLKATFERLKHIFHVNLKASKSNLKKIQNGKIKLAGKENHIKKAFEPKLLNYNNTWDKIKKMLKICMSKNFRHSLKDSFGNGWIYNWHCVDHVDYKKNPRKRTIGYHKIFDKYQYFIRKFNSKNDGFYFHYHPHPIQKFANLCATRWIGPTDKLFQILNRRIIDRFWFPSVNRPGFQVCRPDSHWFLEQFIPFDYANLSKKKNTTSNSQFDVSAGRSGDWRRATRSWSPYHPSHDDYQSPGNCNRWIARCLNIGTRFDNLDQAEVNKAFIEAANNKPVILSFANHDFRDISQDIKKTYQMLKSAEKKYHIKFKFCNGIQAMREMMKIKKPKKFKFNLKIINLSKNVNILEISSSRPIFGPQPYFTFKTKSGEYHHDNLDFQIRKKKWTYTFDEETLPLSHIKTIGVAANNAHGFTCISIINPKSGKTKNTFLN